jgi:putative membrane protein
MGSAWSQLATSWTFDPLAVGIVAAAVALVRVRRRAGGGASQGRDRWLLAGSAVAVLALVSPVAVASGELASAHMVQHLLLVFVVAPLVAAGDPGPALLALLPAAQRRRVVGAWRWLPSALRGPGGAVAAGAGASAAALWLWHAPGLYQAAVAWPALHLAEHVALVVPAVVFWGAVVRRRSRHRQLLIVTVLASVALVMAGGVLGAILSFVPEHLYPVYDATSAYGLSAIEDQRLAGALLWVVGGPAYALAAVTAVIRGLDASGDLAPTAHPEPSPWARRSTRRDDPPTQMPGRRQP